MARDSVDLNQLFGAALTQLTANREALNSADTGNHDHGDNMVQAFQIITKAVAGHKSDPASTALAAASHALAKQTTSGSGQIYAQGLAQAATAMQGEHLTADNAINLINLILGGGGAASAAAAPPGPMGMDSTPAAAQDAAPDGGIDMGDLLSAGAQILAGAQGGGQGAAQPAGQAGGGIDMGDLLSAGAQILAGGQGAGQGAAQPAGQAGGGIDMGDLLAAGAQILAGGQGAGQSGAVQPAPQEGASAGGMDLNQMFNMWMAYRNAKQRGGSDFDAILNAITARSGVAQSAPYRQQSTQIVANALLQAVLGHH